MKASQLMTKEVRTCWSTEPLERAARLMWENDCGSLPVLDQNGRVVGMITDRDVCMAAFTQGRPLSQIPVSQAMSRTLHSCASDDDLDIVETIMRAHRVRRLTVVDEDGHLKGIVSLADIAQRAAKDAKKKSSAKRVDFADVGETLAAVTAPRRIELAAAAS